MKSVHQTQMLDQRQSMGSENNYYVSHTINLLHKWQIICFNHSVLIYCCQPVYLDYITGLNKYIQLCCNRAITQTDLDNAIQIRRNTCHQLTVTILLIYTKPGFLIIVQPRYYLQQCILTLHRYNIHELMTVKFHSVLLLTWRAQFSRNNS